MAYFYILKVNFGIRQAEQFLATINWEKIVWMARGNE